LFPTIVFLAFQIFGIMWSQIEIEIFFSLDGILMNWRRCRLQVDHLDKLTFINKNWHNDLRVGYTLSFNLI
jgi:hypothetical protein